MIAIPSQFSFGLHSYLKCTINSGRIYKPIHLHRVKISKSTKFYQELTKKDVQVLEDATNKIQIKLHHSSSQSTVPSQKIPIQNQKVEPPPVSTPKEVVNSGPQDDLYLKSTSTSQVTKETEMKDSIPKDKRRKSEPYQVSRQDKKSLSEAYSEGKENVYMEQEKLDLMMMDIEEFVSGNLDVMNAC